MSYSNLIRSLDEMEQCEGFDCGHPYDISVISKAEAILNYRFSKQLTHYLSKYGYIGFFGVELYGITKSDFSNEVLEGNMVEWTLHERIVSRLDNLWIPIRFEDDGYMAFMDYNTLNSEGEPRIILSHDTDAGYIFDQVLADDLGDYLFALVEDMC